MAIDWLDLQALRASGAGAADAQAGSEALLEGLNAAQREAVLHEYGPLLILAGAGSGKTRVITRRIAQLVLQRGVAPAHILAITFTNKAAREMKERVEQLVPQAHGLWIGTFHAMGARLLRREIEGLNEPGAPHAFTRDFTIYDTHDRNTVLKDLVREAGFDPARFKPAEVGRWISDWKNAGARHDELPGFGGQDGEVFEAVRALYERRLQQSNALDFDDLLVKVLQLFERQPGLRDLYAERFEHVLVDEYQDTNRVQYELVRHFASRHGNLTVCGDPDQSIYAWRGADIRNILDFERDFGGGSAVRVVKLEQNYRSTQVILDAAQGLIRHNRARKQKELWTERLGGELVLVRECADEDDEAEEIAAQIRGLVAQGRRHDEVALLFRTNFMQRALERGLALAAVPYVVVGGLEFYERREVRDLLAYLQLIVNPADDVAAARAINTPMRGVGDKSLDELARWAADRRLPLARAAASSEAQSLLRGRAKGGVAAFAQLLAELAPLREAPAAEALARLILATDYWKHLQSLEQLDNASREENVEELLAHARAYDRDEPAGKLVGFLQQVALVSDADGRAGADSGGAVRLMTLHSAKGLEFPIVFIAGLEDELLPHARAIAQGEDGIEEERRLLYVGMTRARERLCLSYARYRGFYGQSVPRTVSPFLAEIPEDLVEGFEPAGARRVVMEDEPAFDEDPAELLSVGDPVEHEHFGAGRVEALHGSGANAKASVYFPRHGLKQLLLQYAHLRRVGGRA